MPLKISRTLLERIVIEELMKHISRELNEARPTTVVGGQADEEDEKELLLGEEDPDEVPSPENAPQEKLPSPEGEETADDLGEPEVQGDEDDEADDDLEALEAGEEPPSEEKEGTVAGEIQGKTIEEITIDEDSKIMPGATEIIFTFRETPDAFRLLISKSGKVRFFFRGLHNTLEAEVSPLPADDAPEEEGEEEMGELPDEEMGGEDFEEMPPLGDEDMPPEENPEEEEPRV